MGILLDICLPLQGARGRLKGGLGVCCESFYWVSQIPREAVESKWKESWLWSQSDLGSLLSYVLMCVLRQITSIFPGPILVIYAMSFLITKPTVLVWILNDIMERLSRGFFSFFPLQWLLNHHETDTYNSLGCCGNGFLATSWCQKACVCPRAVSEVDHLPIILISTGHTSLGDFRG